MLKKFEEITRDLTQWELETLMPLIIQGMKTKTSESDCITAKEIIEKLELNRGIKTTDVIIRKIIAYIRVNSILPGIVASSKGYWVASSPAEIISYVESMQQRAAAITAVANALTRDANKMLGYIQSNQTTLFE